MKPILRLPILIAAALILLAVSFILPHYTTLPDFITGFMRGLSISVLILACIKQFYFKAAKKY